MILKSTRAYAPLVAENPVNGTPAVPGISPRSKRLRTIISLLVGLIIMIAVFAFLFPQLGNYGKAFEQLRSISPVWIALLVAAGLLNIGLYPLTAIAAIPHLSYRHAFVNRQAGFLVSNVIPGGGAVAVGTQYAILARYGVPAPAAAAAVSADAVWTYLLTLSFPMLGVVGLVIEGRSTAGFMTGAIIGVVVVIVSVIAIAAILRSEAGARKVARIVQKPVTHVMSWFKKSAPDMTEKLVEFHHEASELVGRRWHWLTITNVMAQLTPFLVLLFALAGLGQFPTPLTLIEIFAAYSIALLLTSFPITPGGLGTVDAALVALLVAFGVDSSVAVVADLIWRLVWFLPQLLVGLGAFGMYKWDTRKHAH